jgi:molybdate transport system ATP-binding protein
MLDLQIEWTPPPRFGAGFTLSVACTIRDRMVGIFGPSGAGKSSLLHLIAGLRTPDTGKIVVDGTCVFDSQTGINVPPHARRLGLAFQNGRLFPHLSVRRNLEYGYRLLRPAERRIEPAEVIELLAIGRLLERHVRDLSGGEQQRVALARALLTSPRLLLLDEPLASLDVGLKGQILPFLLRVHALGIGIVYVSHDMAEILQLTDQLLVLDGGRVLGLGPFHQIVTDPQVFRLAHGLGLQNVLRARVVAHSPERGLTTLQLADAADAGLVSDTGLAADTALAAGTTLVGPPVDSQPGSIVHITIRPEDIAIALQPVSGISIQNQIAGRIVKSSPVQGRALLEVDIGRTLLAEVTPKSVADMHLAPGQRVYCLFKAQAVRCLSR